MKTMKMMKIKKKKNQSQRIKNDVNLNSSTSIICWLICSRFTFVQISHDTATFQLDTVPWSRVMHIASLSGGFPLV